MADRRRSLKDDILELSDAGLSPDQVWRSIGCNRDYVLKVISRSAISVRADEKRDQRVREKTRALRHRIVAAGGHRSVPEMQGCR